MSLLQQRLCVCSGRARLSTSVRSRVLCRLPVNRYQSQGKRCRGLGRRWDPVRAGNDLSYVDDGAVEVPADKEPGKDSGEVVEEGSVEEVVGESASEEVVENVGEELGGNVDETGDSPLEEEAERDVVMEEEVGTGAEEGVGDDEDVLDLLSPTVKDDFGDDGDIDEPMKPVEPVESPFFVGQIVVGRIKWAGPHGSKVAIEGTEFEGWCSAKQYPYRVVDDLDVQYESWIDSGLKREFRVSMIPDDIQPRKGPILSARYLDEDLAFRRMEQIMEVCEEDQEVILSKCQGINAGGVKSVTGGMSTFLPRSLCYKASRKFMTEEELHEKYVGNEIPVAIVGVDRARGRVVVSEKRAVESNAMRNVRPGSLIWGTVRTMKDWGVFVTVDNSRLSCLLHISNISQVNVPSIDDVFQMGDRVCAVVISMEENYERISISTADLEETAGDMLVNKEKVYEHAPQAVAEIQKEIDAQQALYVAEEE